MEVDEQKFEQIIEENDARLRHLCRVYTNNKSDEKDLYQEILIQTWRSLPAFKRNSSIDTWIYRLAINVSISFIRKRETRKEYRRAYKKENERHQKDWDNRGLIEEENEKAKQLYEAISELNASEKAIITMYLEDFSYADIASVTDITENYVGVKLNRIKKKITNLIRR